MSNIWRYRVTWGNWPGAPGYTNLFTTEQLGTAFAPAVHNFFDAVKGFMPTGLQWTFPSTADKIDVASGLIVGSEPWPAQTPVTATGVGNYSGAAGAVVNWTTDSFYNGHRQRGRTFLVPIIAGQFDTNGSLATGAVTSLTSAAGAFWNAVKPTFVIYRRPSVGHATTTAEVTGYSVPDLTAVLRSRRT